MANIEPSTPTVKGTPNQIITANDKLDKDFYKDLFDADRDELPTYEDYRYPRTPEENPTPTPENPTE